MCEMRIICRKRQIGNPFMVESLVGKPHHDVKVKKIVSLRDTCTPSIATVERQRVLFSIVSLRDTCTPSTATVERQRVLFSIAPR